MQMFRKALTPGQPDSHNIMSKEVVCVKLTARTSCMFIPNDLVDGVQLNTKHLVNWNSSEVAVYSFTNIHICLILHGRLTSSI